MRKHNLVTKSKKDRKGLTRTHARCSCGQWNYTPKTTAWNEENLMHQQFELHCTLVGFR
jgi:hypothetical protein